MQEAATPVTEITLPKSDLILDSLQYGLYICDLERRIIYWSKSAERITGWTAKDVVGSRCLDDILAHVDKDGRHLCVDELCPLLRSMVTDRASDVPVIVFGLTKSGERIPMTVSVAPLHNAEGKIIGGVESFHDFSDTYANLERAKRIQTLSLEHNLPPDNRFSFQSFYLPHDLIGGDFFAIRQLDPDHYGFFLADVMGHGVAAALHAMYLSSLWNRYSNELGHPADFARSLNRELCRIVGDESFATAVCGIIDAAGKTVRFASAGGPPLVVIRADGRSEHLASSGLPFGMIAEAEYDECEFQCATGDSLLMFTDGATELHNSDERLLGAEGLVDMLRGLGYPQADIDITMLEEALLTFSNGIRLGDDFTLLELRFSGDDAGA